MAIKFTMSTTNSPLKYEADVSADLSSLSPDVFDLMGKLNGNMKEMGLKTQRWAVCKIGSVAIKSDKPINEPNREKMRAVLQNTMTATLPGRGLIVGPLTLNTGKDAKICSPATKKSGH